MEIIENFLDKAHSDRIEQILTSDCFPWFFFSNTTIHNTHNNKNTLDSCQFCHGFYRHGKINSGYFDLVKPILEKFGKTTDKLIRAKANLIYKHSDYPIDKYNTPHTDVLNAESESILYYVNDSDGDTFIFNEKPPLTSDTLSERIRISPKKNKVVLFDSSYLHASSPPRESEIRIILNFAFSK